MSSWVRRHLAIGTASEPRSNLEANPNRSEFETIPHICHSEYHHPHRDRIGETLNNGNLEDGLPHKSNNHRHLHRRTSLQIHAAMSTPLVLTGRCSWQKVTHLSYPTCTYKQKHGFDRNKDSHCANKKHTNHEEHHHIASRSLRRLSSTLPIVEKICQAWEQTACYSLIENPLLTTTSVAIYKVVKLMGGISGNHESSEPSACSVASLAITH